MQNYATRQIEFAAFYAFSIRTHFSRPSHTLNPFRPLPSNAIGKQQLHCEAISGSVLPR